MTTGAGFCTLRDVGVLLLSVAYGAWRGRMDRSWESAGVGFGVAAVGLIGILFVLAVFGDITVDRI